MLKCWEYKLGLSIHSQIQKQCKKKVTKVPNVSWDSMFKHFKFLTTNQMISSMANLDK